MEAARLAPFDGVGLQRRSAPRPARRVADHLEMAYVIASLLLNSWRCPLRRPSLSFGIGALGFGLFALRTLAHEARSGFAGRGLAWLAYGIRQTRLMASDSPSRA